MWSGLAANHAVMGLRSLEEEHTGGQMLCKCPVTLPSDCDCRARSRGHSFLHPVPPSHCCPSHSWRLRGKAWVGWGLGWL